MKLIINADDFGITKRVSEGIISCMKNGIVTDTSALANSESFRVSAEMAKEAGIKEMGLHLTLSFYKPLLKDEVKSLVDENGYFFKRPYRIPKPYNYDEIERELRAQIKEFLSTGLKISHFDTHHILSRMDKTIYKMILGFSEEYNVPMRKEFIESENKEEFRTLVEATNVKMTDDLIIKGGSPHISESFVMEELDMRKDIEGLTLEIIGHPGYLDDELIKLTSLTYSRERDLSCFNSVFLKHYIEDNKIELINYTQL